MTTLQTLKGFRDFLPTQKRQRDFVLAKFIEAFQQSGFDPLETPTLEYKETIMGKYGEEADKLVYEFTDRGGREVALRYDQTVPLARVAAQYQNELPLPFRRYQVQNVFRADKPQKGRFREFTQCDLDILGSADPLADAEVLATTYAGFRKVGFESVQLWLNDRQVLLEKLQPFATEQVGVLSIIQSIDKLDKISPEDVGNELERKGLELQQAQSALTAIQSAEPSQNLQQIIDLAVGLGVPREALVFTPTLARGLDYYTGMIFEIKVPEYGVGSLGGGGRYDNLIGMLSGREVPAVGVGIGFDRTVEAALELGLIESSAASAQVLVTVFSPELRKISAQVAGKLRRAGVSAELFAEASKLNKQLKYASRREIPWVIVIGEEEASQDQVTLKNMQTGEQEQVAVGEVVARLQR
jgi:histidyl-tRNA synthetase